MPAASRASADAPAASDAAASLREAPLARLLTRRDGDAIAAAGVLARALDAVGVPAQIAPTADREHRAERVDAGDPDAVTVAIGPAPGADVTLGGADRPASVTAASIVDELGTEPTLGLALAGVLAAGKTPTHAAPELRERAQTAGLERRPGVGLTTDDVVDGLAHATSFHAAFSGDPDAAEATLAEAGIDDPAAASLSHLGEDARRRIASAVAVAGSEGPTPAAAARSVERMLRPHHGLGPVPTLEGYADLLTVGAVEAPGLTAAHAAGNASIEPIRDAWCDVAPAVHDAIAGDEFSRYDGVTAYDAGVAPPELVAALAQDARSPEPVSLAIGAGTIGLASREEDAEQLVDALEDAVGGTTEVGPRWAVLRDATGIDEGTVVDTIREAR